MRFRAFIVLLLAAAGSACAHIPDTVRVEIDGHSIVVKTPPADLEPQDDPDIADDER